MNARAFHPGKSAREILPFRISRSAPDADDICVAVATHKAYQMPDDPVYLPVQVGHALHPDLDLGMQADDEGDNISARNGELSELTALYWLWKNSDAPYKGLVQYRRHFKSSHVRGGERMERIATGEDFAKALKRADIVLPKKRNYYISSVYDHYAQTFHGEQFDMAREVLEDMAPEYVAAFDELMAGKTAHLFNMFVMRAGVLDAYCSWLFPIIDEIEARLDPAKYGDAFQARYPGRVSERLLDTWINTNGLAYEELPTISPEPVNWLRKGTGFLVAKFTGRKYRKSF